MWELNRKIWLDKDLEKSKQEQPLVKSTHIERFSKKENGDEMQDRSTCDPSRELKKMVESVIAKDMLTNMIGVFGTNSNVVVNNFCRNLQEVGNDIIWLGCAEYATLISSSSLDIYNNIAAVLFKYLDDYSQRHDVSYYVREIKMELKAVYYDPQTYLYSEYGIPSEFLNNKLLSVINKMKNFFKYIKNPKFLITIEMDGLDYRTLSHLKKLDSSDLIIIVYSLLDFELAKTSLSNSVGTLNNIMDIFFSLHDNLVITNPKQ